MTQETFWIDDEFLPLFQRAGWTSFRQVMDAVDGDCWRKLADRENWRFDLSDERGGIRRIYLKKHHVRSRRFFRPAATAARREADNIARLRAVGVESMKVAAYGQRSGDDGRIESFLATEELTGYSELQTFVPERFAARPRRIARGRDTALKELIGRTADLARRFLESGFNHRDFYAGHFFVRESPPGQFELRLIDLARVQCRKVFRRHWIIKDLAQLAWSLPSEWIGCTDRMAFMRRYLGVEKLRLCDKRLIRAVAAKQQWMHRRLGDMRAHSRPFGESPR